MSDLKTTPLDALHVRLGGKMVGFAGYSMPVQYPMGVMAEHLHCRTKAGLFDVSHMGQVKITGPNVATAFESLMPVAVVGLAEGRQRYGLLTNETGGILDDLMFANMGDHLFVVVNAACKDADIAHMKAGLTGCDIEVLDRALIALQGPQAEAALAGLNPAVTDMKFMDVRIITLLGADCIISRSGYTGEDGFEISIPLDAAEAVTEALLAAEGVAPIGLGARDSLRLEAGLCLYGNDIDTSTTPVEANLRWAIQKARREGERAGGFPGADVILAQFANGTDRVRVGLLPEGRAPMRSGTTLHATEGGPEIGQITSGGFGPTVGGPVSMGYVPADMATAGTSLFAALRGKFLPLTVANMPFITPTYKR